MFSVVLAGGGIRKGSVYGSSDATASEPDDKPLTVEDFATTIYHQLGIVADKELMAPGDRVKFVAITREEFDGAARSGRAT